MSGLYCSDCIRKASDFHAQLFVDAVGGVAGSMSSASAQLPFPKGGDGQRVPNDNVEGTVFQYYGKLQGTPKKEDEDRKLAGKFRIEGSAVFDVSPTFALPSKGEVKKVVEGIVGGKGVNLKLPSGPQQKRLGEYHKISTGKLRFDFNDKESLHGIMIVQKKKTPTTSISAPSPSAKGPRSSALGKLRCVRFKIERAAWNDRSDASREPQRMADYEADHGQVFITTSRSTIRRQFCES